MKKISRKSERYDINLAHDIAKIVYDQLREQLERQGTAEDLPHYEELSKKYNGDEQLKQYLDELLQFGQSVKGNEKDNQKNRQH
jgi:hypothetical protein